MLGEPQLSKHNASIIPRVNALWQGAVTRRPAPRSGSAIWQIAFGTGPKFQHL